MSSESARSANGSAEPEPWYRGKALIIWALILLWPAGLILMWQSDHFTTRSKIGVSILLGLFMIGWMNS